MIEEPKLIWMNESARREYDDLLEMIHAAVFSFQDKFAQKYPVAFPNSEYRNLQREIEAATKPYVDQMVRLRALHTATEIDSHPRKG